MAQSVLSDSLECLDHGAKRGKAFSIAVEVSIHKLSNYILAKESTS